VQVDRSVTIDLHAAVKHDVDPELGEREDVGHVGDRDRIAVPARRELRDEAARIDVDAGAQDGQRGGMARLGEQARGQRDGRCRSGQDDLAVGEVARDGDAHSLADRNAAVGGITVADWRHCHPGRLASLSPWQIGLIAGPPSADLHAF
jgi:hypothetical protein